jgi:hypothetical protein
MIDYSTVQHFVIVFGPNLVRGTGDIGDLQIAGLAGVAWKGFVERWIDIFEEPQCSIGSLEDLNIQNKRAGGTYATQSKGVHLSFREDRFEDLNTVFKGSTASRGGAAM